MLSKIFLISFQFVLLINFVQAMTADINNDNITSLAELTGFIQKWINGEVALNELTEAIQGWINTAQPTNPESIICRVGEQKCEESKILICTNNKWEFNISCQYGCSQKEKKCNECISGQNKCEQNSLYICINETWEQQECNGFCYEGRCEPGIPVSSCQYLNQKNGVYKLTSDVVSGRGYGNLRCAWSCLILNEENVTLDCLGHKIITRYDASKCPMDTGVSIRKNMGTVRNCVIEASGGSITSKGIEASGELSWQSSNNNIIENNIIGASGNNNAIGIRLSGSGTIARNNTISSGAGYASIGVQVAGDLNIISNNAIAGGASNGLGTGIELTGNSNIIENNTISASDRYHAIGVKMYTGNDNTISNNKISTTTSVSNIAAQSLTNKGYAMYIGDYNKNHPNNTKIIRNSLDSAGYDLFISSNIIEDASRYGYVILVDQPIKNFDTHRNWVMLEMSNSEYGNIKLLLNTGLGGIMYISTTKLNEIIEIGYAYAYIKVDNFPAKITLHIKKALNNPQIFKDGLVCPNCNNILFEDGKVTFEVQGAGNYSIGEGN